MKTFANYTEMMIVMFSVIVLRMVLFKAVDG